MATPEQKNQPLLIDRELHVVPGMRTKDGKEILIGLCSLINETTLRDGPGVIGIFEGPLFNPKLEPKPIGYLAFRVGKENSIVCSMVFPLRDMADITTLPTWVSRLEKFASEGFGLQATPIEYRSTSVADESRSRATIDTSESPKTFGDRRNEAISRNPLLSDFPRYEYGKYQGKRLDEALYTNLRLGELLVNRLEVFAKSIGIKVISFDDVNDYAGRLLNRLGYIGKKNLTKTLE